MPNLEQQISDALKQLSYDSKSLGFQVLSKYNAVFLGSTFNSINSIPLRHVLEKYFGISITNDDLNLLIPLVCKTLNMKISPLKDASDLNPDPNTVKIVAYVIHLWE